MGAEEAAEVGPWDERWRYRQAEGHRAAPRVTGLMARGKLCDVNIVKPFPELHIAFVRRDK